MSGAVRSKLDVSVVQLLRLRRRRGAADPKKLEILRRLHRQHVVCDLPRQPETRVEQSFNEQLFAQVFGYETLLSHGRVPFHLQPKTYGRGHYDDFALGLFYGSPEEDVVLATAELKPASVHLDDPQTGKGYGGLTPVQQALRTATEHGPRCRWVIVSNFRELRLYDARGPCEPLCVVDLHLVRNVDDLATLLAHFDRLALLPSKATEAEMTANLDPTHPQNPVPPEDGKHRVVFRFTVGVPIEIPYYELDRAIRHALADAELAGDYLGYMDVESKVAFPAARLREGWVSVETHGRDPAVRFSLSRFGEMLLSVCRRPSNPQYALTPYDLKRIAKLFCALTYATYRGLGWEAGWGGKVSAELREVQGAKLWDQRGDAVDFGFAPSEDVLAGDFGCTPRTPGRGKPPGDFSGVALCVCELAIQFRQDDGSGISLDHDAVLREITLPSAT